MGMTALLAGPTWASPNPNSSLVIRIQSVAGKRAIGCTASLLKLAGTCRLLTNAHCLAEGGKTSSVSWVVGSSPGIPLRVLRSDAGIDVAELDASGALEKACEKFPSVSGKLPERLSFGNRSDSFSALGYLAGKLHIEYSAKIEHRNGNGPSYTDIVPMGSSRRGAFLLRLSDLEIFPGMSGGLLHSYDGNPVALLAHYIPLQEAVFAIPLEVIQDWLVNSKPSRASGQVVSTLLPRLAWSAKSVEWGGANSHSDGGANSHSDGGANSHSDGGKTDLRFLKNPYAIFTEPLEGVPNPENADQVMLGIGKQQIDGWDDYFAWRGLGEAPVLRPRDGYPDPKIRRDLLKRLEGFFWWQGDWGYQGRRKILIPDPQHPEGWQRVLEGMLPIQLDVDSRRKEIGLGLYFHSLKRSGTILGIGSQSDKREFRFKVQFTDEDRLLVLTEKKSGEVLRCDNRNYRKLICQGPVTGFSISSQEAFGSQRVTVRHWQKLAVQGGQAVDYVYGNLVSVGDRAKKEFRKERIGE